MGDPKPTIRIESCRGDGCPVCGGQMRGEHKLQCGCRPCSLWHTFLHLTALLAEVSAQRDMVRGERDQEEARAAGLREERDAATRRADYWQTSEAVQVVVRERDEARERAEKAEALLRECLVVLDPWAWDLLVARIREVLPK